MSTMTAARPELREDLESMIKDASFHGRWSEAAANEFDRRKAEALATGDQRALHRLAVGAALCDGLYRTPGYHEEIAAAEKHVTGGGAAIEVGDLLNDVRARFV